MKKTTLLVLLFTLVLAVEKSKADFTFGEPTNLGPTVNGSYGEGPSCISSDGLELYFSSDRPGGFGTWDIWVTTRATVNDDWGIPVNLGSQVNTSQEDGLACISSDGLSLFFYSNRPGGLGNHDIWVTTRETVNDDWNTAVNLGAPINTSGIEHAPRISADGLELYFSAFNRPGGHGAADIWVSSRETVNDNWGEPVNLGLVVNVNADENFPFITADGLFLYFSEDYGGPYREGGFGDIDMWVTTRASVDDSWQTPLNLGPIVNSASVDAAPLISPDGSMLYFASERPGGFGGIWGDIYQAPIIPIVDLNGDGIVDAEDLCIVVDNWGTYNKLCDVGPMPWGDGVVDVEDLVVIAEHLFEVYPSAETVDVSEVDNGGQVEVELGKLLIVTLESNPSTGYQWELVENNDSVLKQFGEVEFKSSNTGDPPIVGAGGWEIFRFKAVSAGQTTLEFVYHRSWEDAEPLKTFSIQVTVP